MKIQIANKFNPFSQSDKTSCLIPNTSIAINVFPTFWEIFDIDNLDPDKKICIKWLLSGPIENFTTFLDLEKDRLVISGKDQNENFFRLFVYQEFSKIVFLCKKTTKKEISYKIVSDKKETTSKEKILKFKKDEKIILDIDGKFLDQSQSNGFIEKLSFGVYKKQDIDLINRRLDFEEILPFIFLLGQKVPKEKSISKSKTRKGNKDFPLLDNIETMIAKDDKNSLEKAFKIAYKQYFIGLFCPTLLDENHLGIIDACKKQKDTKELLTTFLVAYFYELIRKMLFVEISKKEVSILPTLATFLHHGRLLNLNSSVGNISIEWSKKLIKKVIIKSNVSRKIKMIFQKPIKQFRLRENSNSKGVIYSVGKEISLKKDKTYFLDRFTK
jgi:hypothetical protein